MLNIVIINGGRGASAIIPALLARQGLNVTSVVNAFDDGKSTGEIRRFFGMVGPSDIRKVQELMLPVDDVDYESNLRVFRYRFPINCVRDNVLANLHAYCDGSKEDLEGTFFTSTKVSAALRSLIKEFLDGLNCIEQVIGERFNFADCSLMNCIYAGAFLKFNRNIEQATIYIDKLFKLQGTVLPTSIENKKLVALRENGQMLHSEAEIVELRSNVRIENLFLLDNLLEKETFNALSIDDKRHYLAHHHCYVSTSLGVKMALQQADIIIYSAGTQHSSLYPTYMSVGLSQAIAENKSAYKVFITNIGADYETPNYLASDYILGAYRYLNFSDDRNYRMDELFDVILINQSRLKADETYVVYDSAGFTNIPVRRVIDGFESLETLGKHDGNKVVQTILDLYEVVT